MERKVQLTCRNTCVLPKFFFTLPKSTVYLYPIERNRLVDGAAARLLRAGGGA